MVLFGSKRQRESHFAKIMGDRSQRDYLSRWRTFERVCGSLIGFKAHPLRYSSASDYLRQRNAIEVLTP